MSKTFWYQLVVERNNGDGDLIPETVYERAFSAADAVTQVRVRLDQHRVLSVEPAVPETASAVKSAERVRM